MYDYYLIITPYLIWLPFGYLVILFSLTPYYFAYQAENPLGSKCTKLIKNYVVNFITLFRHFTSLRAVPNLRKKDWTQATISHVFDPIRILLSAERINGSAWAKSINAPKRRYTMLAGKRQNSKCQGNMLSGILRIHGLKTFIFWRFEDLPLLQNRLERFWTV